MASFIQLVVYLAAAVAAYLAYVIYRQYIYWKERQMPHLELIPLVGNNAVIFWKNLTFFDHIQNLYKRFPGAKYYGMFNFTRPTVLIKDTEIIRDVVVKNFEYFTDHAAFVTEEMDPVVGRNLFALKGQKWKKIRSLLTPNFTSARMKMMFPLIEECSNDFVEYFLEHPEKAKNFEAKEAFCRYTCDVIATAAFGLKVNSLKHENNEFYQQGSKITSLNILWLIKYLTLRYFPKIARLFGLTFFPKSSDTFLKNLIKDTIKTRREKGIVRQDMIQLMMQAMDREDDEKITMDDVLAQSFIFFTAGFETAANLMSFFAQNMAAHPEVQEKLYEEISKKLEEDGGKITYEAVMNMKYLNMAINETLRLYPATAITNRLCVKDYEFEPPLAGCPKYRMEKNTIIIIPIYALHHDEKHFPDPEKFDPERFSDENKDNIEQYAYMPFGLGPRQCIGNRFALMETKILLINVIRRFVIKFNENSRHPVVFATKSFVPKAEHGFWLQFEERKKTN